MSKRAVYDDCFKGTTILHPSENIYSANLILDDSWFESSDDISVQILGDYDKLVISPPTLQAESESFDQNLPPTLINLDYQMMETRQNPSLLIQGEMAHKEDIHSCDLDLFIVNDLGRVVVDNHVDSCTSE